MNLRQWLIDHLLRDGDKVPPHLSVRDGGGMLVFHDIRAGRD